MSSWGSIAIATRIGSSPEGAFFRSWTNLVRCGLDKKDVVLDPPIGLPHHYAAEEVAKQFLSSKAGSLLFVDDDMVFEADTLRRMRNDREGLQYDVLQAHYLKRVAPHKPLIIRKVREGKYICETETPDQNIVDAGVVGLGFTLIRRQVFERIMNIKKDGVMIFHWGPRTESEDYIFSRQADDTGSRLGVMTKVRVGHIIKQVISYGD